MAFDDRSYAYRSQSEAANAVDAGLRAYMLRVYNFMASGVALTGIVSWLVTYTSLNQVFFTQDAIGRLQPAPLAWVAMIASVGIVFGLSAMVSRMQASTATALFWAYAGINGVWMAAIFSAYTGASVVRVFFITAAAFASLSLYGYTTKRNLDAMGSFMVMGLFGIIIASVVNIFLQSPAIYWISSVAGVLIFSGLTAWDTQKIRESYWHADGSDTMTKKAVIGALTLYLDFINLFLMLLRFFGDRRD